MAMPTEPMHCLGVVLAGGRSSRMGSDKALLNWQGRPLIEHMRALRLSAGAGQVLFSGISGPQLDVLLAGGSLRKRRASLRREAEVQGNGGN